VSPDLASILGAVATSAVLAASKTFDTRFTNSTLFRKLQPVFTLGGAYLAPVLASHGLAIDPSTFAAAPLATTGAIVAAELLSLFRKK